MSRPSFANPVGATLSHLGSEILVFGRETLVFGCEILVFGCEILVCGCKKKNTFFLIAPGSLKSSSPSNPHLL